MFETSTFPPAEFKTCLVGCTHNVPRYIWFLMGQMSGSLIFIQLSKLAQGDFLVVDALH